MPAEPITPTAGHLDVGDTWLLAIEVRDDIDNELADADVAVLVVRPDTSTAAPVAERESLGQYVASYVLAATGRHTAVVTVSGAVVSVVAFAVDAEAPGGRPTLAEVKLYAGDEVVALWDDSEFQDALDAETASQARVCRVGAVYPDDLAEALKRRVVCNLARRPHPLAVVSNDADGGATVLPGRDPEVRRLEGPHRKMVTV